MTTISFRFLPETSSPLETLEALADPLCFPFSEKQAKIFEEGRKAHDLSKRWLSWRGYSVSLIPPSCFTLLSFVIAYSNEKRDLPRDFLIVSLALAIILWSGASSMQFTGNFPDRSSNAQNLEQNELENLRERFKNIAFQILSEWSTPNSEEREKIAELAAKFDEERLSKSLTETTTQKTTVTRVFQRLFTAVRHIQGKSTSDDPRFQIWVNNIDNTLKLSTTPSLELSTPSSLEGFPVS